MGVPVIGNGTSDFPAFYCRKSGFGVDYAAKNEAEIAAIIKTKWISSSMAACSSATRFRKNTRWTSTRWSR